MIKILDDGGKIILEETFRNELIIALLNGDYGLTSVNRNSDRHTVEEEVCGIIGTANYGNVEITLNTTRVGNFRRMNN